MRALPTPTTEPALVGGRRAPSGGRLPWSWARQALEEARNYWIATNRPGRPPHCRPVWGVWQLDGFWFTTGSRANRNLAKDDAIAVHLESGQQVVIVEGRAVRTREHADLIRFAKAVDTKYGWDAVPADDGVTDPEGNGGPVYVVRPGLVLGWNTDVSVATRWEFGT
ncbi:hypothetical protein GCM10012275_48390 [Longimycelium tulufanense]|uniref:Pyridoxamine 5'-phosphate oxidase N-terminal domain-containing protein n=1 Tax=Longimycelium tulufanense TaxID=907463 RepID=A0A8J3CJK1_9PSEU|nr:pyridoxamine 5'-phosphate oxidase family protein [Longimycelium tulufanense]GGM72182.1 hypothetical protein GCM10012275_48390 [Longimycelium tulufanense]